MPKEPKINVVTDKRGIPVYIPETGDKAYDEALKEMAEAGGNIDYTQPEDRKPSKEATATLKEKVERDRWKRENPNQKRVHTVNIDLKKNDSF